MHFLRGGVPQFLIQTGLLGSGFCSIEAWITFGKSLSALKLFGPLIWEHFKESSSEVKKKKDDENMEKKIPGRVETLWPTFLLRQSLSCPLGSSHRLSIPCVERRSRDLRAVKPGGILGSMWLVQGGRGEHNQIHKRKSGADARVAFSSAWKE